MTEMSNAIAVPAIAGLAVGIFFVALMSAGIEPMREPVDLGDRAAITIQEGAVTYDILSEYDAIAIAINATHGMDEISELRDVRTALFYLDENGEAFEIDVETLEKSPTDDFRAASFPRPMHYWDVFVSFGETDGHSLTINASNGNVESHVAT